MDLVISAVELDEQDKEIVNAINYVIAEGFVNLKEDEQGELKLYPSD